jgi:tetratricopeptide (TPR) repeat protein
MSDWRLIYLDGSAAIFAQKDYAPGIPELDAASLAASYRVAVNPEDQEIRSILDLSPPGKWITWLKGFYRPADHVSTSLLNIASFYLQLKNFKVAEYIFLEYHRRTKGRDTFIYYALADVFRSLNERDLMILCYQKILQSDPKNPVVAESLKKTMNDTASPVKVYSRENEIEAITAFNEGNRMFMEGEIKNAIGEYEKAIRLNPAYYKAFNNLGIVYASALENYTEAIRNFDKAIEIKPDYADAWLGRGTSRYYLHDYQGACKDLTKAKSLGSLKAGKMMELYCR